MNPDQTTAATPPPGYSYHRLPFTGPVDPALEAEPRMANWPAVYVIDNQREVYVGETTGVLRRRAEHAANPAKAAFSGDDRSTMRVILHGDFNKSAALDLEAYLIELIGGDEGRRSLNGNTGIRKHEYYDRPRYQAMFEEIFERLRADRVFSRSRDQIINSTVFKLSPFKSLNPDQEASLVSIVSGLLNPDTAQEAGPYVVQGGPGTGKTVLGVFLMKLLVDLAALTDDADETGLSTDEVFAPLFTLAHRDRLLRDAEGRGLRLGILVPQQSLRKSLRRVFKVTPGLDPSMVLSVWDVGGAEDPYDVLIVDEAHRLGLRSAQANGSLNNRFSEINQRLFGEDDFSLTQLDWVRRQSRDAVLLVDPRQTVRPADIDADTVDAMLDDAKARHRFHALTSQMRVKASDEYVDFFARLLRGENPEAPDLGEYDLRMFTDFGAMQDEIRARDAQWTLSRLAAGFAWKWQSKGFRKDPSKPDWDIELDGVRIPWNVADTDWVDSPGSLEEMGSIHTLQGYDLNYAGVVIGPDLQWDEEAGRVVFSRADYADTGGKKNNTKFLGRTYSDEDLREYVINIYNVLLTRGVRGTYLYVVDPGLRAQLARWFPGLDEADADGARFGVPAEARSGETSATATMGPVDIAHGSHAVGLRPGQTPMAEEERQKPLRRG